MGYNPTSRPNNQTASAAIEYKEGEVWVFYYEAGSGELFVLKGGSGKEYTYSRVLDGDGKPILLNDETSPIATTITSKYLHLYFVEQTTNLWKELLIDPTGVTRHDTEFTALKLKVGSPATVSATTVDDNPRVYLTIQGTEPLFSVGTYGVDGGEWNIETIQTPDEPSDS